MRRSQYEEGTEEYIETMHLGWTEMFCALRCGKKAVLGASLSISRIASDVRSVGQKEKTSTTFSPPPFHAFRAVIEESEKQ